MRQACHAFSRHTTKRIFCVLTATRTGGIQALDKETDGHIRALLLSNRSAALANLARFHNALQDADR